MKRKYITKVGLQNEVQKPVKAMGGNCVNLHISQFDTDTKSVSLNSMPTSLVIVTIYMVSAYMSAYVVKLMDSTQYI